MELTEAAAMGGKGVGFGLTALALVRLFQWAVHLACARLDKRQVALDVQQKRVDDSLAGRLRHLEEQELVNRDRIQVLEEVATTLICELRSIDPGNPKLHDVAVSLRRSIPFTTPNPTIDESIAKLREIP